MPATKAGLAAGMGRWLLAEGCRVDNLCPVRRSRGTTGTSVDVVCPDWLRPAMAGWHA